MKLPLLILLLAVPMSSMAHGGRTDSSGCHRESATGRTHCHGAASTAVRAPGPAVVAPTVVAQAPVHTWAPVEPVHAQTPCYVAPCRAVPVYAAPPREPTPSHWSKDVNVDPAPAPRRVASSCPSGTVSSNLIIDQAPATCAPVVAPVVRVAPRPAVCTTCVPACTAMTCARPTVAVKTAAAPARPKVDPSKHSFYFKNCEEAFTAKRAPLHRGDDGYRPELDEDGDGLACDPMVML